MQIQKLVSTVKISTISTKKGNKVVAQGNFLEKTLRVSYYFCKN